MFWKKNNFENEIKSISTKNFYFEEFFESVTADRKGIDNMPDNLAIVRNAAFTLKKLQEIRDYVNHKIFITSGFRSKELNKEVGGSPKSQHMLGLAADIICPDLGNTKDLAKAIKKSKIEIDQCIVEYRGNTSWVHIGFKQEPRNSFLIYKDGKYSIMS
jgi:uncharacterized protein YcbK (DUF882 family)